MCIRDRILLYDALQSRVWDTNVNVLLQSRGLGKPEFEQYKQLLKNATQKRDDMALWRLYIFFTQFHVDHIRRVYEQSIL